MYQENYSYSNNQPKNQDTWTLSSTPMITTPITGLPMKETFTREPWHIASYKPRNEVIQEGYESGQGKMWTLKGPQPDYAENYDYGYRSALVKCKNCKEDFCLGIS